MLLYKFRFITIPSLTTYKNLKSNSLQRNLTILQEEQYVERRFDSSYTRDRKPAIYYLTPKAVSVLKTDPRFNPSMLHAYYKNKAVSDTFMQHAVATLATYNVLSRAYGDHFEIFTTQEIAHFDDFPKTTPDLYLRGNRDYFVTLAHDAQPFLIRKRLTEYIAHFEEEGWVNGDYPALLFIFASSSHAERFLEFANTALEDAGIDDDELRVGVATTKALHAQLLSTAIWTFTGDDARTPRQLIE